MTKHLLQRNTRKGVRMQLEAMVDMVDMKQGILCRKNVKRHFQGFMKWPRLPSLLPHFVCVQFLLRQIYNRFVGNGEMAKMAMCFRYNDEHCASPRWRGSQTRLFAVPDEVCTSPSSNTECDEYLDMTRLKHSQKRNAVVFDVFSSAISYKVTSRIFLCFLYISLRPRRFLWIGVMLVALFPK